MDSASAGFRSGQKAFYSGKSISNSGWHGTGWITFRTISNGLKIRILYWNTAESRVVTSYCALALEVSDNSSLEHTLECWIVSDWNIHCWSKGKEWKTVHSKLTGLNRATYIFPAERTEGAFVANKFILAFVIKITQGASGGYNCYSVFPQMTKHPSLLKPCIFNVDLNIEACVHITEEPLFWWKISICSFAEELETTERKLTVNWSVCWGFLEAKVFLVICSWFIKKK